MQVSGLFATTVATALLGSLDLIARTGEDQYRITVARWAENRRRAETQRRDVLNKVLELAKEAAPAPLAVPNAGNPVRQALEFFRRYQLDLQIAFYGRSGARHGSWAGALAWITAALAGVAAVSGIPGGLGDTAAITSAFLGNAVHGAAVTFLTPTARIRM